jgi:glycosyltransferase involved in cell wall biosynthesis
VAAGLFVILKEAIMRILLVGNYALDNQTSMSRYTDMVCRHMNLRGHMVEVIRPTPIVGDLVTQPTLRKWLGYVDKYLLFPLKLRSRAPGFDIVHVCDHSNSMYLSHTGGVPSSITCHDLLAIGSASGRYPQQKVSWAGKMQQRWILRHLLGARSVVCVSGNTARELAAVSDGELRKVVVIPNAVEFECSPASQESVVQVRKRLGIAEGERYLFHVGGNLWYKNRPGVLRIFKIVLERLGGEAAGLRLVMAGAPFTQEMREFVATDLPVGSVIETVKPSDEDLRSLYSGAAALLFPSLHEGFGWPLIEAQCCECPVITSNRAPMTEVVGTAALFIDPTDEVAAAAKIAENLDNLPALREGGFKNAKRFDPAAIFQAYEGFFAGALRTRRSTDVVVAPNEAEAGPREIR